MIRFVVVEDNKLHQQKHKELILKFMMKNDYEFDIMMFTDITRELNDIIKDKKCHNIYILDFELPKSNAIDIARTIREEDWTSPIIICTAHAGMAFETFKQRLQILDFVCKQYESDKNMLELFEICMKQLKFKKSFKFKKARVDYNIPFNKILYFERDTISRKVKLVTDDDAYELYRNLKEIKKELDDDFILTHRACVVNMNRVIKISWKDRIIYFDNEESTNLLSKTHKKEIDKYYGRR